MSTLQQLPGFERVHAKPCPHCAGLGVLEVTDMFCGAGGSSLGLEHVCCHWCGRPLIVVVQAINHWDLAVEAHNANFPNADHDVHDVEEVPAKRFRRTPLFWASPECVNHTSCKGARDDSPEAQRSRATFKDIVRFTEHHRYDAVIVENVVEARLWCEHEDCACGAEFDAWFQAMLDLGYEGQVVYFNSQFALPTPQSRDRMYVVFWRKGARRPNLDFRPVSWCSHCETIVRGVQTWKKASRGSAREKIFEWGRYGGQYVYLCPSAGCGQPVAPAVMAAKTIIDWDYPIERIADRQYKNGKRRELADNTRNRIRVGVEDIVNNPPEEVPLGGHLFSRKGRGQVWSAPAHAATATSPFSALILPAGGQEAKARSAHEPSHTIVCSDRLAMVTAERSGNVAKNADEPLPGVTTRAQVGLITRVGGQSQNGKGRSVEEPLQTIVTSDRQVGLVIQNMTNNVARDTEQPLGPVTTGGNHMLVRTNRGDKGKNVRAPHSSDEPVPTVAGHGEMGLVEFRGDHGTVRPGDLPAHTVTAQGTHHGMLVYNGMPGFVRDLDDAAGTVTGRDKQSLLVPYYSTGVAREVEQPLGTVTTHDREALVITEEFIDDCYFRMLQWPELLRAQMMHLHADGTPYELTARRRNHRGKYVELSNELRTKMIGNAVSSPVATMLGHAVMEALR